MNGDWNVFAMSRMLVLVGTSLLFLLLPCEFGEWMTGRFDKFNDAICECKWYLFSIEMQRMYLIVLANAQQPEFVRSFGNISCLRESFKKVCILHRKSSRFQCFILKITSFF